MDNTKPIVVDPVDPTVATVWKHWLETVHAGRPGLEPALSPKRHTAIVKALKHYPVEVCLRAIDGVILSPFHMGNNSRRKRYCDITLILRDPEHIEKFVGLAEASNTAEDARQAWVNGGS